MTELLIESPAIDETKSATAGLDVARLMGDEDLERRVLNFLVNRHVPGVKRLEIEAHGGTLTLRGRVGSYYLKQLCGHCAQRVAGVIRLVNAIQVVAPDVR